MHLSPKDSASSRNISKASFDSNNIIPGDEYRPATRLRRDQQDSAYEAEEANHRSDTPRNDGERRIINGDNQEDGTPPHGEIEAVDGYPEEQRNEGDVVEEEEEQYDLKAPPPTTSQHNVEHLITRFFSVDHLDVLIKDPTVFARFKRFLQEHRPDDILALQRYIDTRKAIIAVDYANAIAREGLADDDAQSQGAAIINDEFETQSRKACEYLIEESLPAYITHRFVGLVTDTLVKEITGNNAPIMKELVPSLAEVYCLSDPSLPDNPMVYASEEFYTTTQYGKDYTIGRNCRFLQGPKTASSSVNRLIEALNAGREIVETILNYRRDGTPFVNLLMIAPLYDNKGKIRYFLGCQIDVSSLVEDGRGLESFAQLLSEDRSDSRQGSKGEAKDLIGNLGSMLNDEEINMVKQRAGTFGETPLSRTSSTRRQQQPSRPSSRLLLGMDDPRDIWPSEDLGHSGRLPGVYQNYLLVRPFPSLRITFTSPALRIPGLMQTRLMDRIGGPQHVREAIYTALEEGASFTAKVTWFTNARALRADFASRRTQSNYGTPNPGPGRGPVGLGHGKTRWIHCTPLLGSDDRVGVWMVVMVEAEEVTGKLNRPRNVEYRVPRKPEKVEEEQMTMDGGKLYADYLRKEGNESQMSTSSTREKKEVNDHFRDF